MGVHSPATQPTAVTNAGKIVPVPIPGGSPPLRRVLVVQTAGSAASFTVEVSSDSLVTTRSKRVAYFTGGSAAAPVDFAGPYYWFNVDGNAYVKIVPDAGADNNYDVFLFTEA